MKFNNIICYKFDRRINDEIAAGCQFDYITFNSLKSYKITDPVKKLILNLEAKRIFGLKNDSKPLQGKYIAQYLTKKEPPEVPTILRSIIKKIENCKFNRSILME